MASVIMFMKRPETNRVLSSMRALGPGILFAAAAVVLLFQLPSCGSTPETVKGVGAAPGAGRVEREVPWNFELKGYHPGEVTVVIDDRVAREGEDFVVDTSTGTLRFLKAADCTPKTRFFISYYTDSDTSVAFGNHPRPVEILDAARSGSGESPEERR